MKRQKKIFFNMNRFAISVFLIAFVSSSIFYSCSDATKETAHSNENMLWYNTPKQTKHALSINRCGTFEERQ